MISTRDTIIEAEQMDNVSYWHALTKHAKQWNYKPGWRMKEFYVARGIWPQAVPEVMALIEKENTNT